MLKGLVAAVEERVSRRLSALESRNAQAPAATAALAASAEAAERLREAEERLGARVRSLEAGLAEAEGGWAAAGRRSELLLEARMADWAVACGGEATSSPAALHRRMTAAVAELEGRLHGEERVYWTAVQGLEQRVGGLEGQVEHALALCGDSEGVPSLPKRLATLEDSCARLCQRLGGPPPSAAGAIVQDPVAHRRAANTRQATGDARATPRLQPRTLAARARRAPALQDVRSAGDLWGPHGERCPSKITFVAYLRK